MQLGFALSAFSDDDIKVDYKNGLLDRVAATAVDRSRDIALAIATAVGRLREGPAVAVVGATRITTRTFDFDPFNREWAIAVNKQIAQAAGGGCVEVEIHPGQWSPGCPSPLSMASKSVITGAQDAPNYDTASLQKKPGIYFRRGIPRTVHVVLRGKHIETKQMLFANEAPVYRVDVKRSAFVRRETVIAFADGELTSVQVKKDSEALAVATLPVAIVNAYVGGVVDAFFQRKRIQDARADYYTAVAARIDSGVKADQSQDARDKYECLAAHPIDTTECD
jgi:hypothetical protein